MIIRCERCSTLYELDEGLLSPEGSAVQCTKCEHVFKAFPPRAAGRTLVGVPVAGQASAPRAVAAVAAPGEPRGGAAAAHAVAAAPEVEHAGEPHAADDRAADPSSVPMRRSGLAPVYRPPTPPAAQPPSVQRVPMLRKDAVGAFEGRT